MGFFDDLFGSSKETTTTQNTSSETRPWQEAMPLIGKLLSGYGGQSTGVTGDQSAALDSLKASLSNLPNFGGAGADAISQLFKGIGSSGDQVGMLKDAYGTLQKNLSGTASGANLNPYETPGFGDALRTIINDTTNAVKSQYAGSGRTPVDAGTFAQTLGRGITSGTAPTIASQYGANYRNMIDANNALFSGAGSTSSSLNNLNASNASNTNAAIQGAGALPGLYGSPSMARLGAANLDYGQGYQNLAQLLQPSVALAGLGSNSSGTGTSNSTQTSTPSLMSGIGQGLGMLGTGLQMGPSIGSALSSGLSALAMFSDRRLKTDIEKVGKLNDGQNVYSYRYKGDATPQIGLMADEVEKRRPEAVVRHPSGFKMVRYDLATRGARVGALREAA